jgi:hypothetical protein
MKHYAITNFMGRIKFHGGRSARTPQTPHHTEFLASQSLLFTTTIVCKILLFIVLARLSSGYFDKECIFGPVEI